MKTLVSFIFAICFTLSGFTQKVAHINTNDLVDYMPEKAVAFKKLLESQQELEAHLNDLMAKLNLISSDVEKNHEFWSPAVLKMKEQELQQLAITVESFKISADQEMAQLEIVLLDPIITKAKEAISAVAKKENIDYVIDSSTGSLLVMPQSEDLMKLVKKELGIVEER